jgi:hypothetical protein
MVVLFIVFGESGSSVGQPPPPRPRLDLVILEGFDDNRALREEFLEGLIGDDHRKSDPFREAFS